MAVEFKPAVPNAKTISRQTSIPLAGLSTSNALGDFRQRVADAQALDRPIDGGGGTYELDLKGETLNLGNVPILDAELVIINPPASTYAVISEGQRVKIATGWQSGSDSTTLTLPANHGLQVGDRLDFESDKPFNDSRTYYLEGEKVEVVQVLTDGRVVITPGLRATYDAQYPATVYRLDTKTTGHSNLHIRNKTPGKKMGFLARHLIGPVGHNLRVSGFQTHGLMVQGCDGSLSLSGGHDNYSGDVSQGLDYSLGFLDLCNMDVTLPQTSGGRHAITHGGNRPGKTRFHGGSVRGAGAQFAFDVHGGWYSCEINGTEILGGLTSSGYILKFNDATIDQMHAGPAAALYLCNEARTGSSVTGSLTIRKRASAGDSPSIRSTRDTSAKGDVLYGTLDLDVDIVHEVGSTGTYDKAFQIETTWRSVCLRGAVERIHPDGQAGSPSAFRIDRIHEELELSLKNKGEPISIAPMDAAGTLRALTRRVRIDIEQSDVGNAAMLHNALEIKGASDLGYLPDIEIRLRSDNVAAAALYVYRVARLLLHAKTTRSGRYTTNSAGKNAVYLQEVNEAHLLPGSVIDERLANALYAIQLNAGANLWIDGPSHIRAPNTNLNNVIKEQTGSTLQGRHYTRPSLTGAIAPNVFNAALAGAAVSVPAGGAATLSLTLAGVRNGEQIEVISTPVLPAGVTLTKALGTAADTITLTFANSTAGMLEVPAGNYSLWAARWNPQPLDTTGTTAQRPTRPYTGQTFYDTTISKLIFYKGTGWVDMTGTAV